MLCLRYSIPMKDKIAIITGASSGIGQALALDFARRGARVALADLDETGGGAIARDTGGLFVKTDLASAEDCSRLISETLRAHDRVDILVNCAGFQHVSPIESFDPATWNKMIAVLLTAPFLLTRGAWPSMKRHGWGRIVNIASIHALVASPFKSAYVTAKHGLLGFTKTAALEGGACGITVNAICPAYVRTPLVDRQIADQARNLGISPDEVISRVMLEPSAVKRLIEPDEIAEMAAFLCSDAARSISGAAWTIDGGWTAR